MRKPTTWFPNRPDTKRSIQTLKMNMSLTFRIKKVQEQYFPCSENNGDDQLLQNTIHASSIMKRIYFDDEQGCSEAYPQHFILPSAA